VTKLIEALKAGEEGHAQTLPGLLTAAVGAILLGIGAANDTGWLAVAGGIVLALGLVLAQILHHTVIDYELYERLEAIEKK
jgi:hypothetical protein